MDERSAVTLSYGVGHRLDWDPALLCLWFRAAAAAAPIGPLAWDPPYVAGAALKRQKKKKKKRKKKKKKKKKKKERKKKKHMGLTQ